MTKTRYSTFATILSVVVFLGLGILMLNQQQVSAAGQGSIIGTVRLSGTPPHMRGIDMSKDPYCSKAHASEPARMETVIVGEDQGLQNVVLYISQGLSASDAAQKPSATPVFDQKGCMYSPHVMALDAGQEFKVTNSDQTLHNVHPEPNQTTGNAAWNLSQPPGAPPIVKTWKSQEIAIPLKCNIHPWMHGWHVVVKGPYATTDKNGSYTIHGVSPGSYTVSAWQEELGTQTARVTVRAGAPAKADFTFKAK